VTPVKGQDVLVRALGRIADLAWTCTCVGSLDRAPDFVREVRGLIRDADLDDRVELAGEQDESSLGSLYRHSSIVVLPSHHESYGMVLTEAMARGLPVVSTTAGAIPDTVPGAAGILVPPGDVEELAAALRSLLEDAPNEPGGAAQRRQRLGSAGRRHASRLPTWDEAAAGFEDAVSVLAGGAARAGPSWTA
jgi:glycosyltransferase involved in cell wall biosynthesis